MLRSDRFTLTLIFALIFSMLFSSVNSFAQQCDTVREETFRLHIIANSDSEIDQANKLLVRDAVLAEYSEMLCGKTAEQAALFADFLKAEIELTAEKTLLAAGCSGKVKAEVTDMYFDTRTYQDGVTLPAGNYTALRLIIGEGKGQNWWCVMYPPLCIPACMGEQAQKVTDDIMSLEQQPAVKIKFATVELAQKISQAYQKAAG